MKIIEELSDYMNEELDDAEKYVRKALEVKDTWKDMANLFFNLSNEEMTHMNRLHNEATKIIDEYRKRDGEPPNTMLAIYEYIHKKLIDKSGKVKALQALYQNGA